MFAARTSAAPAGIGPEPALPPGAASDAALALGLLKWDDAAPFAEDAGRRRRPATVGPSPRHHGQPPVHAVVLVAGEVARADGDGRRGLGGLRVPGGLRQPVLRLGGEAAPADDDLRRTRWILVVPPPPPLA